MKVRIRDVVSGGIKAQYTVKPDDIGLSGEDLVLPDNEIRVSATLNKVDGFILVKADVTFIRENHCARCLERLSHEVTSAYEIDLEFDPGDEWVDLGARIREEMLMEYRPRALCREECKGICPDCGAELNTEQCTCHKPPSTRQP